MKHSLLRRRLGIALLLGYAAIVALAAWRHEVRPRVLDRPVIWARSLLALAGIPPGVAVFSAETNLLSDRLIAWQCFEVRVVKGDAPARRIYPRQGGRVCPAPSPRIWVRGEQIALYRLATILRAAASKRRDQTSSQARVRFARLAAESIAEHFRASEGELTSDRYALLWTESHLDYASGQHTERVVALVRWQADPDAGVFVSWSPDDRRLGQHWPVLGAP